MKNKFFFFLPPLLLAFHFLTAQPQTHFYRAWTTNSSHLTQDFTNHVVSVVSGTDTYVAGSTLGSSVSTYVLILSKYNARGTLQWSSTFTVNTGGNVHAGAITLDPSGNVLITGSAYNGTTNGYDLFVAKFNDSGTKLWHQLYNGGGNSYDGGTAVVCGSNSNVYVSGGASQSATNVDVVTICYNSSGTAQWTQTWNNVSYFDFAGGIGLVSTGGGLTNVRVTGFTQVNATTWEYLALSYASTTGTLGSATHTNVGGTVIDKVNAAAFDAAGNVYITGAMGTGANGLDVKTVKLDASLNILWTATYNGTDNKQDVGRGIAVDAAGNVYVAGYTTSNDDRNALLIKYSSSGSQTWTQSYAGQGDDEFADLAITADSSIFVGGYINNQGKNDFYAALYSSGGIKKWSDSQNGLANRHDEIQQVVADGLGNFIVSGRSQQSDTSQSIMTTKYALHYLVVPNDEAVHAPFIADHGQKLNTDGNPVTGLRYYSEKTYPNVYLFDTKVSYVFAHIDTVASTTDTMTRVDLSFYVVGGRTTIVDGLDKQEGFHNYYLGHIPEGRERVPLQNKVLAPAIYPHIDAIYGQGDNGLFIHLICKAGSTPSSIKLEWSGATSVTVQSDSSLLVQTILEDLVLPKMMATTISSNGTESATSWSPTYVIGGDGKVSISLGTYDTNKTLVIKVGRGREEEDCNFYWSTYFGHALNDASLGNDVDKDNYMYFTGVTSSPKFPATVGLNQGFLFSARDVFATRFRQFDIFDWGTFYGGNEPAGGTETSYAIKWRENVSSSTVYITGRTSSTNFPLVQESGYFNNTIKSVASGMISRGFIVKLNAHFGVRRWATFFGDSQKNNDAITSLFVREDGNVVVGGYSYDPSTTATSFPFFPASNPLPSPLPNTLSTTPHVQTSGTMFLAEFDGANNSQTWATRLGNSAIGAAGYINNVADIDEMGDEIYITGMVSSDVSTDFIPIGPNSVPYEEPGTDAFIMRFAEDKTILWSTCLGGSAFELPNSIVCKSNGNFYVTGTTTSDDFPISVIGDASDILKNDGSLGGVSDIYVSRFSNEEGSSCLLRWSRYVGGPGTDMQGFLYHPPLDFRGPGNASTVNGSELLITGSATGDFEPILGPVGCPYYYDVVDRNLNDDGADALITVFDADKVTFSTYWGGADGGGGDTDYGNAIATGTSSNGVFLLLTGYTSSKAGSGSETIPVCYEDGPDYYNPNLIGGVDAFISKLYYGTCVTTDIVERPASFEQLDILPNPAYDFLQVQLPEGVTQISYLSLFDATGKNVTSFITTENFTVKANNIDISHLSSGLYCLSVRAGNKFFTGKFIKM